MFIKYRRSFFLLFTSFFVLFFSHVFSLAVYADDIISVSPLLGVQFISATSFRVYSTSGDRYNHYRTFCISGEQLNNAERLVFIPSSSTNNSCTISVYGYSSSKLPSFTRPTTSNSSKNVSIDSTLIDKLNFSNATIDFPLDQYTFDDSLYYYFSTTFSNSNLYMKSATIYPQSLEPTPTPTSISTPIPSSVPSASPGVSPGASPESTPVPTLDDYNFWTYCYDQTIKEGGSSPGTAKLRFVPSSVADFSDAVHNYVYTFNIKIPFRIASNFNGIGYVDANYRFDLDYGIMGVDGYGTTPGAATLNKMVDFSNPWIESSDGISFNASLNQQYGYGFDVFNVPLDNGTSQEFYYCFDMYVSLSASGQLTNFADYVDIMLTDITYNNILTTKVSDTQSEDILGQIRDEQAKQDQIENEHYQEEQDKIAEAESSITEGASQLTETLSSWEIFTMPFQIVQDLVGAISSDGSTGLTFPSFTLMGHQLWPSYTFDLQVIAEKFPVLYNGLHLITGIMVVSWFIHYCWRKWHILMGDDMPEDT